MAADAGGVCVCVCFGFVRSVLFHLIICCLKSDLTPIRIAKIVTSFLQVSMLYIVWQPCPQLTPESYYLSKQIAIPFGATSSADITHCIFKDILIFSYFLWVWAETSQELLFIIIMHYISQIHSLHRTVSSKALVWFCGERCRIWALLHLMESVKINEADQKCHVICLHFPGEAGWVVRFPAAEEERGILGYRCGADIQQPEFTRLHVSWEKPPTTRVNQHLQHTVQILSIYSEIYTFQSY